MNNSDLFLQIASKENIKLAHKNAKKDKGNYEEVLYVDKHLDKCVNDIHKMLINKAFTTSDYKIFYKNENGKIRKLYKLPYFPDRIIQWAVLQVIMPYIDRQFIKDTYSAISDRGPKLASERIEKAIRTDFDNFKYCLQIDIKHYYRSINHQILKDMYWKLLKDPDIQWLIDDFIDSIGTADENDLIRLEAEQGTTRIPIGNYFSQPSGNLYLSGFDHWIKETKHVKYYYRYMDDMIFGSSSRDELYDLLNDIADYLWTNLHVTLKTNWKIFSVETQGIDFIGYRFFKDYTLLRKRTAGNFKRQSIEIQNKDEVTYHNFCSINSFKGFLDICNSFRLRIKYLLPIVNKLYEYYNINIGGDAK